MQTVDYTIEGMTCGGCVKRLTALLEQVEGVHQVFIDLASGVARLEIEETQTTSATLVSVIEEAGFDVV